MTIVKIEGQELIQFDIFQITNVLILSTYVAITMRLDVIVVVVNIIFICILAFSFLFLSICMK